MLPYADAGEAEAALGRGLTAAELLWLRYSGGMHDFFLHGHNILFLLIVYTLAPLPVVLLELLRPKSIAKYKLQPKSRSQISSVLRCYRYVVRTFLLAVVPIQLVSYPTFKFIGIRTSLPLPTAGEVVAQLAVYFVIEDFFNYWIHRGFHSWRWGYEKIHSVHHEFTAPIGFAAPYAHPVEVVVLGLPAFLGPAIVPGHILTFWLWMVIRHVEAIETHCGYDFPQSPTRYIPFYGGAEYHDYHHYIGGKSQSNFASIFTYCDYIYGTDKGYRYQKGQLAKLREQWRIDDENREGLNDKYE